MPLGMVLVRQDFTALGQISLVSYAHRDITVLREEILFLLNVQEEPLICNSDRGIAQFVLWVEFVQSRV
jgi:hypothetical protein